MKLNTLEEKFSYEEKHRAFLWNGTDDNSPSFSGP